MDKKKSLSESRQKLLNQWIELKKIPTDLGHDLSVNSSQESFDPSFSQARLLKWQRQNPNIAHGLNLFYLLDIYGGLDEEALRQALQEIQSRHKTLRSRIVLCQDALGLTFENQPVTELRLEGFSNNPYTYERAVKEGKTIGQLPFGPDSKSLIRMVLFRLGSDRHILLLAAHHLVFDQWSMGIFIAELSILYSSFKRRMPSSLNDLPIQFTHYCHWENSWISSPESVRSKTFWAKQLDRMPAPLKLPGYRASNQKFLHGSIKVKFENGLTEQVKGNARRNGLTPYVSLLTSFARVLHRMSGNRDIVIGNPVANRQDVNVENLIGFFVNNLPMRIRMAPGEEFVDTLESVRTLLNVTLSHQKYPYALIEKLAEADRAQKGLYQCVFSYQNSPMPSFDLENLSVEPIHFDYGMTVSDIALFLIESDALTNNTSELAGIIHFNAAIYSENLVWKLWENFLAETTAHA